MCIIHKGATIKGITIVPKVKPKPKPKPKPKLMTICPSDVASSYYEFDISAADRFWDDWDKYHFDIGIALAFVNRIPNLEKDTVVKITDGKSVILGKRTGEKSGVLIGGYQVKKVYSPRWAEKNGMIWTPHREIRVGLDHTRHFVDRYKKRRFNLALMVVFISRVPTAKLGQRIKVVGEDDIFIGTRTSQYGAMLITGMKRGEIDLADYVDYEIGENDE